MKDDIFPEDLSQYPPLTRVLLAHRGIQTQTEADIFLNPDYTRDIHDPFLIHGMDKAVERILGAIAKKERIVVYSDYDADGIPGGVILHDFFAKINYPDFKNYIPHRHKEGYGLNTEAINICAKEGATLLITVDCGITDTAEVAHARTLGIDIIITDHHLPHGDTPPAYVILNSKQGHDSYPDDMLCGAGVAWKLVCALLRRGKEKGMFAVSDGWEKWLLDMAGLSTIADMVPLRKENRALAYFGLKVLRKSSRPGLLKLLRKMNLPQEHLSEDDIGFMIAPRINAASRMDTPMQAFRLLSTNDETLADELSGHLHRINDERKNTVALMVKEIKKELRGREPGDVIVIGNPRWRIGVLGIAAANIMEEYRRPVFVWGREGGDVIKGSCRSDGSVDVVKLMNAVSKNLFLNVGGHEFSGGFSVTQENIHILEDELLRAYKKVKKESHETPPIHIDAELSLDDVIWKTYKEIEQFSPFGAGNPKPTFLFKNIVIDDVSMFGKKKNHLKLRFKNNAGKLISAIGFFMDTNAFEAVLSKGHRIDLVAVMEKSMFRNIPELRLRIVDIQ